MNLWCQGCIPVWTQAIFVVPKLYPCVDQGYITVWCQDYPCADQSYICDANAISLCGPRLYSCVDKCYICGVKAISTEIGS